MVSRIIPRVLAAAAIAALIGAAALAETHQGKVVEAGKGKLTMTDMDGKNRHTHDLSADVKIMSSGKSATIDALKKDTPIEVTTEKKDGKTVVTRIDVLSERGTRETKGTVKRSYQDPDKPGHASTRASKLVGATVKNAAGENLGKIEDIVMDPHSGTVRYAVLSFGGFLGLGDKWFAIPWHALAIQYDSEKKDKFHFVLNVDKEKLKNAPGFDKNNWPDTGNPRWAVEVDTFYEEK